MKMKKQAPTSLLGIWPLSAFYDNTGEIVTGKHFYKNNFNSTRETEEKKNGVSPVRSE